VTTTISLFLTHIPFIALFVAIIIAVMRLLFLKDRLHIIDGAIRWALLLPVGIAGIWGAVMHIAFANTSAALIGWQPSPFQFEVGVANLGMGVIGIIGFWRKNDFGYWLATILFTTCLLWGAAIGHIHQMVVAHNTAPGNAGLIFYTDWAIPAFLWLLLIVWIKVKRRTTAALL
jgi:Family of unknown function (DUF6790)